MKPRFFEQLSTARYPAWIQEGQEMCKTELARCTTNPEWSSLTTTPTPSQVPCSWRCFIWNAEALNVNSTHVKHSLKCHEHINMWSRWRMHAGGHLTWGLRICGPLGPWKAHCVLASTISVCSALLLVRLVWSTSFASAKAFYDDNGITIDGHTDLSFTEDVGKRFEGYGWQVQKQPFCLVHCMANHLSGLGSARGQHWCECYPQGHQGRIIHQSSGILGRLGLSCVQHGESGMARSLGFAAFILIFSTQLLREEFLSQALQEAKACTDKPTLIKANESEIRSAGSAASHFWLRWKPPLALAPPTRTCT